MKNKIAIKKYLTEHNISYQESSGQIVVWCPFCHKEDFGTKMLTCHIRPDGFTQCMSCYDKPTFEDLAKEWNPKDKIIDISDEQIVFDDGKLEINPKYSNEPDKTEGYNPDALLFRELIEADFGPEIWFIEKLIPINTITVISGDPESFKTWLTMDIALKAAKGELFLSKFPTMQKTVLFIDEENTSRMIQKRYKLLNASSDLQIHYLTNTVFKITKSECLNYLEKYIEEHNIGLVIMDSLIRIHNGDENTARDMSRVYDGLRRLRTNFPNLNIIVTHHHRKQGLGPKNVSQMMRGSSDILASVDVHLAVSSTGEQIALIQNKLRGDEKLKPFNIDIIKGNAWRFEYSGETKQDELAINVAKEIIANILQEKKDLDRKPILQMVKEVQAIGNNAIGNALSELLKEKKLKLKIGHRNKQSYSLNEATILVS